MQGPKKSTPHSPTPSAHRSDELHPIPTQPGHRPPGRTVQLWKQNELQLWDLNCLRNNKGPASATADLHRHDFLHDQWHETPGQKLSTPTCHSTSEASPPQPRTACLEQSAHTRNRRTPVPRRSRPNVEQVVTRLPENHIPCKEQPNSACRCTTTGIEPSPRTRTETRSFLPCLDQHRHLSSKNDGRVNNVQELHQKATAEFPQFSALSNPDEPNLDENATAEVDDERGHELFDRNAKNHGPAASQGSTARNASSPAEPTKYASAAFDERGHTLDEHMPIVWV